MFSRCTKEDYRVISVNSLDRMLSNLLVLFRCSFSLQIEIANWVVQSHKPGELVIVNRDGNQQRVIIAEDLPGFVFESSRQTKHCFQAEKTLGKSETLLRCFITEKT